MLYDINRYSYVLYLILFSYRRDKAIAEREYKKAKNLKKKQRFKDLEEQREKEKSKWQNFNTKVSLIVRLISPTDS